MAELPSAKALLDAKGGVVEEVNSTGPVRLEEAVPNSPQAAGRLLRLVEYKAVERPEGPGAVLRRVERSGILAFKTKVQEEEKSKTFRLRALQKKFCDRGRSATLREKDNNDSS